MVAAVFFQLCQWVVTSCLQQLNALIDLLHPVLHPGLREVMVEIPIDVKRLQSRRVAGRWARLIGLDHEAQTRKVQILDQNIDHPNYTVVRDTVTKAFGKRGGLVTILAFNESAHRLLLAGNPDIHFLY